MKEGMSVDIIQFADDTLLIEGGGWKNVWGALNQFQEVLN